MKNLIVYGFESCGDCQKAKAFMQEHNMKYDNRDINLNPEHKAEFLAIADRLKAEGFDGIIGVPCFVMDGETVMMAIYDENGMNELLRKYNA